MDIDRRRNTRCHELEGRRRSIPILPSGSLGSVHGGQGLFALSVARDIQFDNPSRCTCALRVRRGPLIETWQKNGHPKELDDGTRLWLQRFHSRWEPGHPSARNRTRHLPGYIQGQRQSICQSPVLKCRLPPHSCRQGYGSVSRHPCFPGCLRILFHLLLPLC